ncbi:MAG: serine/threonine protein kinase [Planctomycetes bacterium]|nr:serine/threonine protein kinase [Planctomycetota bacterium]
MAEPELTPPTPYAPATARRAVPPEPNGPFAGHAAVYAPELANAAAPDPVGLPSETDVPAADETDLDAPDLPQITGYRVVRAIGGGGMGTVFRAIQLGLNRVVALKLINAGWTTDSDFRQRFDREVKTLAALEHANIVPVYDAGSWQGVPYLTMKFVAGKTLYHRLEAVRRDLRSAARMMVQVARAVHYLHAKGIVHRDLKPLNILLTTDGTPLVADFGLVRPIADDSDLSLTLVPLGTRQYMSPEQTRGGRANYTPACDIWALGVILYELLTGFRPFSHDDPVELVQMIRCEPVPPVPDRNAPPELEAITRKCLAKLPAERYATAEALAADLERWLVGEPVTAPLPVAPAAESVPVPAAPAKKSRRSRVLLSTGAVALLAAGAAWAGGVFGERTEVNADLANEVPAPSVVRQTPLERFEAGEPVALTDDKGRPIGSPAPFPEHDVGTGRHDGYHGFFTPGVGAIELSGAPFPLPLRVEGAVAVTQGEQPDSLVAVYVGRRSWADGGAAHRSFVWFGTRGEFPAPPAEPQLVCGSGLYWWPGDWLSGTTDWDHKKTPWKRPGAKGADPRFARVEIEVRPEAITGRVDGVALKPVTVRTITNELASKIGERRALQLAPVTPPVFGPGIGVFVRNADGIVTDLRVTKVAP